MVTQTTFQLLAKLPQPTLEELARDDKHHDEVVRNLAEAARTILAQRITVLAA